MRFIKFLILSNVVVSSLFAQENKENRSQQLQLMLSGNDFITTSVRYITPTSEKIKQHFIIGAGFTNYQNLGKDVGVESEDTGGIGIKGYVGIYGSQEIVPSIYFNSSLFIGQEVYKETDKHGLIDNVNGGSPFSFYGIESGISHRKGRIEGVLGLGFTSKWGMSSYLKKHLRENTIYIKRTELYPYLGVNLNI